MSEDTKDLMERLIRLETLMHRYQIYCLKYRGPFGNPHRGQGRVLSILKMQPEISQKELGYLLDMRNQSLGELLGKLERSGYITRTPSETDRRTTNIKLTPEGAEAAAETDEKHDPDSLLSCLNDEEQANLSDYLERMIAQLEQQIASEGPELPEGVGEWLRVGFRGHHLRGRGGFDPRQDMRHFGDARDAMYGMGRGSAPGAERFDPDYDGPDKK